MLCYVLLFLGIVSLWWHWRARVRMKVTNLTGKYTFITGCDTEFGNTAAKIFDKNGFRVFASSLTETGAKKLKAVSLRQLQTALLDVRDSESVKKVAAWVKAEVQSEDAAKKQKPPTICLNKDISPVVQCMEHALTSLHPHAHSIAGQDAKLLWNPLSRMPGVIQDFLLLRSRVELAVSHAK